MGTDVVILENVTKVFSSKKLGISKLKGGTSDFNSGKIIALENISLKVAKGEVIGVIGLNGSGKTTLLRVIAGIYLPDSGSVQIKGKLAPLLQIGAGFQNELIAQENIMMFGLLYGLSKSKIEQKVEKIIDFAELGKFSRMKLKYYSAGMRTRLAISTALEINPDILLIDEVLAVGDQIFKQKSFNAFSSFIKKEKTIVFTSHNMNFIKELSDRVLILNEGKMVALDEPEIAIKKYNELILKLTK